VAINRSFTRDRRAQTLLALIMTAFAVVAIGSPSRARASASSSEAQMAREIAADINRERAARGLSALAYDTSAAAGAQQVAEHDRDTPCHSCHSGAQPSGEVVYWAYNYPSGGATNWWMNSDPHRNQLMSPDATAIGIGVACNSDGTEFDAAGWVTVHSEPASPKTPVVTKTTQGSRCAPSGRSTPTPTTTAAAASHAATTATSARNGAASTTTPTTTSAASGRRTTTTTTSRSTSLAAARDDGQSSPSAAPSLFSSQVALGARGSLRRAAALRAGPASGGDVGGAGTLLLVLTFTGTLAIGVIGRRRA
jgi:cysteine-rich secretory family protein